MNLPIIISNNRQNCPIFLHLAQDGALPVGQPLTVEWCTKDGEPIRTAQAQVLRRFVYSDIADLSDGLLMLWMGSPNATTYLDELGDWFRADGADPMKPLTFYVMQQTIQ